MNFWQICDVGVPGAPRIDTNLGNGQNRKSELNVPCHPGIPSSISSLHTNDLALLHESSLASGIHNNDQIPSYPALLPLTHTSSILIPAFPLILQ